jgi:hypothetical protein
MVRSEGDMSLKNPVTPLGIDLGTVRLVAQRLIHYATPGPLVIISKYINYIRLYFYGTLLYNVFQYIMMSCF